MGVSIRTGTTDRISMNPRQSTQENPSSAPVERAPNFHYILRVTPSIHRHQHENPTSALLISPGPRLGQQSNEMPVYPFVEQHKYPPIHLPSPLTHPPFQSLPSKNLAHQPSIRCTQSLTFSPPVKICPSPSYITTCTSTLPACSFLILSARPVA